MHDLNKIHHIFEAQAKIHPNRIAVSYRHESLTYKELNSKANKLAHFIASIKDEPANFIPILVEKSINTVISMLAILKVGAAYVPISTHATQNMVNTIIECSRAKLIITDLKYLDKVTDTTIYPLVFDNLLELITDYQDTNLVHENPEVQSDNAYLIYTSGTTGSPKGVLVTHQNVVHTYTSWELIYQLTPKDIHLQMANPAFDVFTGDIIRGLCSGAEVVLCPNDVLTQPDKLHSMIIDRNITCAEFIPAVLRSYLAFLVENNLQMKQFRLLLCGSDVWTMEEYRRTKKMFGTNTRVINSYGLTEATIDSTYFEELNDQNSIYASSSIVPIGRPFPHVSIYILNHILHPANLNEVGEIYIGGKGIAVGYLNQRDLTAERFVVSPFIPDEEKLYKTGDFGKVLPNGTIDFLGRNETHIKINGQRVELLSFESMMGQHPKIKSCIAYSDKLDENKISLSCFILLREGGSDNVITHAELIDYVKNHFPSYYIPRKIQIISEVIFTQNGKIDRTVSSQKIVGEITRAVLLPRNGLEKKILAIWHNIIGHSDIGVTCNFYDLGGSSLSFISMLSTVNKEFDINLSCYTAISTIEGLSQMIHREHNIQQTHLEETGQLQ